MRRREEKGRARLGSRPHTPLARLAELPCSRSCLSHCHTTAARRSPEPGATLLASPPRSLLSESLRRCTGSIATRASLRGQGESRQIPRLAKVDARKREREGCERRSGERLRGHRERDRTTRTRAGCAREEERTLRVTTVAVTRSGDNKGARATTARGRKTDEGRRREKRRRDGDERATGREGRCEGGAGRRGAGGEAGEGEGKEEVHGGPSRCRRRRGGAND